MLDSLYAGLASSNASLGLVHAMAHSAGGFLNLPHGFCNTHLLPVVVSYNFDSIPHRYRQIANQIAIRGDDLGDKALCEKLIDSLFGLIDKCGIKRGFALPEIHNREILNQHAEKALKDPCIAANPKIPNKEEVIFLYESSG